MILILPVASQPHTVPSWNLLNAPVCKLMSAQREEANKVLPGAGRHVRARHERARTPPIAARLCLPGCRKTILQRKPLRLDS